MLTTLLSLVALFATAAQHAAAQTVVNGQIYTKGLAIVDAPQPGTTLHAGATQSVAIDISGDGHLPASASTPGSTDSTRFDSLEVYLVSYPSSFNLTVSEGPGLLSQEPGSTVKHINWLIDSCIQPGDYNLTFYEASHINGDPFFIITPIPIEIQNTSPSGACSNGTNPIQAYPQAQSAPDLSPWLNSDNTTSNVTYPSVGAGTSIRSSILALVTSGAFTLLGLFTFL